MTTYYVVPDESTRRTVRITKESNGEMVLGKGNEIMTERRHEGDENGQTEDVFHQPKVIDCHGNEQSDMEVILFNFDTQGFAKESKSDVFGRLITGRLHQGDENGKTQYQTVIVKVRKKKLCGKYTEKTTRLTNVNRLGPFSESAGTSVKSEGQFMVGRDHQGDENGSSTYSFATLEVTF